MSRPVGVYARCWCNRPIRDPDAIECAEHDNPTPTRKDTP